MESKTCLQCGKIISQRAKYCSDKCRMAYKRRTQPEHEQTRTGRPEHDITAELNTIGHNVNMIENYGTELCQCLHCQQNRSVPAAKQKILNHGAYKPASQLKPNEINRVSLPGDPDYAGCCYQDNAGQWRVRKRA